MAKVQADLLDELQPLIKVVGIACMADCIVLYHCKTPNHMQCTLCHLLLIVVYLALRN